MTISPEITVYFTSGKVKIRCSVVSCIVAPTLWTEHVRPLQVGISLMMAKHLRSQLYWEELVDRNGTVVSRNRTQQVCETFPLACQWSLLGVFIVDYSHYVNGVYVE